MSHPSIRLWRHTWDPWKTSVPFYSCTQISLYISREVCVMNNVFTWFLRQINTWMFVIPIGREVTRHVPRSQQDPESWVPELQDSGPWTILDPLFSFARGILEILDPVATTLMWDPIDLGYQTESRSRKVTVGRSWGSWILKIRYIEKIGSCSPHSCRLAGRQGAAWTWVPVRISATHWFNYSVLT